MRNIGILTFHFTTNYGAVLQAYSVQKILLELGYNAEIVDYRQKSSFLTYARSLFINRHFISGCLKVKRFLYFQRRYLNTSSDVSYSRKKLKILLNRYDAVVVGSDEVWKLDSFRGYDSSFFLDFPGYTGKKMSFSASAGATVSLGDKKKEICKCLEEFDNLFVRDSHTKKLIKDECGLVPEKSLDPTLLVNFSEFERDIRHKGDYVLIYGALTDQEQTYVKSVAVSNQWRIISIGSNNKVADINIVGAGIEDWINYIRLAKSVFTIFFHGVIFSLKYHGEVCVFHRANKSYKIRELVHDLALEVNENINNNGIETLENYQCYKTTSSFTGVIERNRIKIKSIFHDTLNY